MARLFLCHSSSDKAFVRKLGDDLNKRNVGVWVDEREILVGDPIREKIEQGLKAADYLGVVLSPSSLQSEWVKKELDAKLIEEIEAKRVMVLPILLKNCDLPPLLKGKLYADFRSDYESGLKTLLARFQQNDRETEVKRKVLEKLAGDDVVRVDPHQLMSLAVSSRQLDAAEELLAVHDAAHPGCSAIPQVRAAIDVFKYDVSPSPDSWLRAVKAAVELARLNPAPTHFQLLENLCVRPPEDRQCVGATLNVLDAATEEVVAKKSGAWPVIVALLIQAVHRMPIEGAEILTVAAAAHHIIREHDRATLRPILGRLLHAATHLVAKPPLTQENREHLRQVYLAARIKVDRSQEYSDAFLHLAWAAAQLGNRQEAMEWLDAYRLTVPAPVFASKIQDHKPLDEIEADGEQPKTSGRPGRRRPHKKQKATRK